ncbi:ComF family protein [Chitinophaga sp. Mgbs1]|uniref:ComF family protein n=1 Tax=Chitinophaga solisilvae TaxID=1233460 RepID=A0A433W9A3_9BACT|nr:ComF family protein [Chitinophaga solisilvae]
MIRSLLSPLVHLFYPHCCELCGTDLSRTDELLCMTCQDTLPATNFHLYTNNPVSGIFSGRLPVTQATAAYYYSQASGLQRLIHRFKYRQRKDIALWLGKQMGHMLQESAWAATVDAIVPVPLNPRKEKERGYNQAAVLAAGIASVLNRPVLPQALVRSQYTSSQTRKNRISRWENVQTVFSADSCVNGRHVLLIDDVITTGATTEACGHSLLEAGAGVSICCLAYAYR